MEEKKAIIIIPAYEPDHRLKDYVDELAENGFSKIIVVDDGSGVSYRGIFSELQDAGIVVLRHMRNFGKGQALRTAFLFIRERYSKNYPMITVDADGQHLVPDVIAVYERMQEHPDQLILGTRDFTSDNVPFKSRQGNRISARLFKLSTGIDCPDTQTGLRGIPAALLHLALKTEGDRYEYEMNFLTDAAKQVKLYFQPITTVYENNNACSHFRPVQDSLRIYGRPVRFALISLLCAGVDFLLFYVFSGLYTLIPVAKIFSAAVSARVCSGFLNFELNRRFSFKSKGNKLREAVKYGLLFVGQMLLSAGGTALLSLVINSMVAKLIIDTCLFVISYLIQKHWVFTEKEKGVSYEKHKKVATVDAHI
ncbi:MAG: bifunctional glycosyltransferase family 2/GtrA family protein [Lachnospiraceae bacterium]|nr:bifunctional glycosyltransferase family 2/GtrA family protein [Lachnospiraceae bacterium]